MQWRQIVFQALLINHLIYQKIEKYVELVLVKLYFLGRRKTTKNVSQIDSYFYIISKINEAKFSKRFIYLFIHYVFR